MLSVDAMRAECRLLAGHAAAALEMIETVQHHNLEVGAPLSYLERIKGCAQVAAGDRSAGLALIRASLAEARRESSLYDEWRCVEALADLDGANHSLASELARLRRAVTDQLGVALPV